MPGSAYWGATPPPLGVTIDRGHPMAPHIFVDARQSVATERVQQRSALHTNSTSNANYRGSSPVGPVLTASAVDSYADNWPVRVDPRYPAITVWVWACFDPATYTDFKNIFSISTDITSPFASTMLLLQAFNNGWSIMQISYPETSQQINGTSGFFIFLPDNKWHLYTYVLSREECCTYRDTTLVDRQPGGPGPIGVITPASAPFLYVWLLNTQAGKVSSLGMAPRAFTHSEVASLYTAPYQMFTPPIWKRGFTSAPVTQVGVPISDISTGTWTTTPLYAKTDELDPDDNDYIISSSNPVSDTCEVGLTSLGDPNVSTGHVISYRYEKTGDTKKQVDLTVSLMQGATLIKSWTHTNIGDSVIQQDQTLSGAEADSITDYTDLRLRFVANAP